MCIMRKECQRCETCGQRKYQFWADKEMHPRGCPWEFDRMDACPDAVNSAKRLYWCMNNDIDIAEGGKLLVQQMLAANVDLTAPQVSFSPDGEDVDILDLL